MVRIESVGDAERMKKALRGNAPHVGAVVGAPLVGINATSADRVEMDPADFDQAIRMLKRRCDELSRCYADSADLETPLADGGGPVALQMRRAFGLRAGDVDGGARNALRSYIEQLTNVIEALESVKNMHLAVDADAAATLKRQS